MKAASLSFFRFEGAGDKLWALAQMQFARRPLRGVPDIGFHKLLGSGTGEGFNPFPNFSVYAILATWPSLDIARTRIAESAVFRRYCSRAVEDWTVFLAATQSRGRWDGSIPFAVLPAGPASQAGPIAVLTRASVKPRHAVSFWRRVPNISAAIRDQRQLLFKIGLGEVPWLHQVTFSVWRDRGAMERFAYCGFHAEAIARVRAGGWFSEELFARFRVLGAQGHWDGTVPLSIAAEATCDDRAGATAA